MIYIFFSSSKYLILFYFPQLFLAFQNGRYTAIVSIILLAITNHVNGGRMRTILNNVLVQDDSLPECSTTFQRLQDEERLAHSPYPPDMKGSWVSQE